MITSTHRPKNPLGHKTFLYFDHINLIFDHLFFDYDYDYDISIIFYRSLKD